MSQPTSAGTRTPITREMRAAFDRNAATALKRRSDGYLVGLAMNVAQWLVIGCVALFGLYYWNWQPLQMLVVFVAGIAVAAVADLFKWLLVRRRLLSDHQKMRDDLLVWNLVTAMQLGRNDVPEPTMQRPGVAIVMDIVLGAVGIWVLLGALGSQGPEPAALLDGTTGLRGALIAVCAAPLISLLSSLFAGSGEEGAHDDLEFRAGGRGISLLMLGGLLAVFGDKPDWARSAMIFINGATVFFGVLAVFGVWIMVRQREWLRAHLREAKPL